MTNDADVANGIVKLLKLRDISYKLARHIRNTDEIHPATWGAQGLELLAQLREIDPERYDKEVK